MAKKIVYHHIPKCGGMSIAAGIGVSYFPLQVLRFGGKRFPGHLNARAASGACEALGLDRYSFRRQLLEYYLLSDKSPYIFGHYPFSRSAYDRHKDEWAFVILFRDPVKRWYSEYFWNRYKDHDYAKTELDMEAYLESEQGKADTRSFLNFLVEAEDSAALASDVEVKQALENLACFDVLGTLEDLCQFKDSLKKRFGYAPFIPRRNKSPAPKQAFVKAEPGSAFDLKLRQFLEADIEIYQAALKIINT